MPRWVETIAAQTNARDMITGAGVQYLIQANNGHLYLIYIDNAADITWRKSTDGGFSWGPQTVIFAGSATALSAWYDRWSGIAGDLIHIAYQESGTDDTLYRTIDTASADALSTQTSIFVGSTTANGGTLSICRARGGNVYCATMIDAGAEGGFFRLPNANVPNGAWDAARTTVFEAATQDQVILLPGFAADNQDMIAIFWDASADEISRKLYDDSANTWGETSIAASMVDQPATTAYPHFDAFVDLTNNRNVIAAWSAVDLANADLRCWTVTEVTITEVTNIVQNSTDNQGLCAISINTGLDEWWAFYAGKSDGSETYLTDLNLYCKASRDAGTTWGVETKVTDVSHERGWLATIPRFTGKPMVISHRNTLLDEILVCFERVDPKSRFLAGVM